MDLWYKSGELAVDEMAEFAGIGIQPLLDIDGVADFRQTLGQRYEACGKAGRLAFAQSLRTWPVVS